MTRLRDDKKDLNDLLMEERAQFREDREKLREENELLHKRAATTEREKAELRDALEEQATQWKSQQERYERELNEVKAMLQKVTREIRERHDQVNLICYMYMYVLARICCKLSTFILPYRIQLIVLVKAFNRKVNSCGVAC